MNHQVIEFSGGTKGGWEDQNRSPSNTRTQVSIVLLPRLPDGPPGRPVLDLNIPGATLLLLLEGSLVLFVFLCIYQVKSLEGPQRCLVTFLNS